MHHQIGYLHRNRYSLFAMLAFGAAAVAGSAATGDGAQTEAAQVSAAACAAAPAWAENVQYGVGSLVAFGGSVYRCIQAHTSLGGWTPAAVPALWSPAGCSSSGSGGSGGSGNGGG